MASTCSGQGEHKASPLLWYGFASRCVHGGTRNVAFPSPGHFTLCVIHQQSL